MAPNTNEPERHARAMTDAWIAAHKLVQALYPTAHYEFGQAGPSIEIQVDAEHGLVFGTCDTNIGADVDEITGDYWEPTGTPIDTPLSSDSEDADAIASAILQATAEYQSTGPCVDPDHGVQDHPCDEVLGRERAAQLRKLNDAFDAASEFDATHPGYWEYRS